MAIPYDSSPGGDFIKALERCGILQEGKVRRVRIDAQWDGLVEVEVEFLADTRINEIDTHLVNEDRR